MIILILIPFLGNEIASTYRWIDIGLPFGFQPSEFAKWIIVIALARYLSDHNLEMNHYSSSIIPIILVIIPAGIVLNQPDLGSAIIILVPLLPMLYWVGARPFHPISYDGSTSQYSDSISLVFLYTLGYNNGVCYL